MTVCGESLIMQRLAIIVSMLAILTGTAVAAGASVPPFPRLTGTWSHAEINVTIRKVPHTLIDDRGKVAEITTTQLVLREGAGVNEVIPLSAQTLVTLDGQPATISDLRRRMTATTLRVDGGAAVRVRATSF
jgi:hypothetical protein